MIFFLVVLRYKRAHSDLSSSVNVFRECHFVKFKFFAGLLGGSKDSSGKENQGKQKKSKGEGANKSSLVQMAENMAQSLQQLNDRLGQQL